VTGLAQDDDGVDVALAGGKRLRAAYVVGADGGRSVVRRASGVDFVGAAATRSSLIAEVAVTEDLPDGVRVDARGIHGLSSMEDGSVRVVVTEEELGPSTEPCLDDLRQALRDVFGTDFGVHDPTWLSRFTDATRQAAAYRDRRVLLAGDAAHVHSPTGGLGIGLGIQDAVNLGWKLAQVVGGHAPTELLDSYHAERHPAGARALAYTMAQSLFQRADPRQDALKGLLGDLLVHAGPRDVIATLIAGLDVRYAEEGHPLLGRRIPDLDLVTADGPQRAFALLHQARPMLLDFGGGVADLGGWADRVRRVAATYDGSWELPVAGTVDAPAAVLVRPDGHVAWVGDGGDAGLVDALTRWFGPADR
jgi:3-(3-hydroxy-phenyl)propionate hydroxylase